MPSQYRRYAVDAAGSDKRCDLWNDWDDILASVANYLHEYGWTPGGPVLSETSLDPDPSFQIEPHNLELDATVGSLGARGVKIDAVRRKYLLHKDIERELQWMGPLEDLPPKLG
jgi:membrane-bound lytic murein transglycosylase B